MKKRYTPEQIVGKLRQADGCYERTNGASLAGFAKPPFGFASVDEAQGRRQGRHQGRRTTNGTS
jgi:hypothetical protein